MARKTSLEDLASGSAGLATSAGWMQREWLGVELIELFKPASGIGNERLQQDALWDPADAHAVALEAELFGQTYRLAAAVLKELGNIVLGHKS